MGSRVLRVVVTLLVLLAVLTGMMEYRARSELKQAREFLAAGHTERALTHYGRSLSWYVPGGAANRAAEDLLRLGLEWARDGHEDDAARALMRLRSGLYAARGLYTPRLDLIGQAEPELARLRALEKLGPEASPVELERQSRDYLDLMQRPARPGLMPSLAAAGGFVIWVAAVLLFIARFFTAGGPSWRRAGPFALLWAAGFIVWLWGMKWA